MRQLGEGWLGLAVLGIFLISAFFVLRFGVSVYRHYEAKQWKQDLLNAIQSLPTEMLVIDSKTKQILQEKKPVSELASALRQHPLLAYSRAIVQSGTPVAHWQMRLEDNRLLRMYRVEISNNPSLASQLGTDAFGVGLDEQGRIGLMALYPSDSVECAIGQGRVWM